MRALGAKVILTPAAERGSGMVKRAEQLAGHRWFSGNFKPRQSGIPCSEHYWPEILRDFAGERLDFGSRAGHRRHVNRAENVKISKTDLKIIATEPEQAALLSGGDWSPHKFRADPDLYRGPRKRHRDQVIRE